MGLALDLLLKLGNPSSSSKARANSHGASMSHCLRHGVHVQCQLYGLFLVIFISALSM